MRIWTLDEANEALPRVVETVARITDLAQRVRSRRREVRGNGHSGNGNGDGAAAAERELQGLLAELDDEGITVRDPERGLIDFTAESSSARRYWLCHLRGEPAIEWWHWPDDGFAGRRPATELPD